MNPKILWPVVAALAIGVVAVFYPRKTPEPPAPLELPPPSAPVERSPLQPPAEPEPEPVFRAEPEAAESPPLPALDESDAEARAALAAAAGQALVDRYVVRDGLIRKLVATVDNLTGPAVWTKTRLVPPIEGAFLVEGGEDAPVISAANAQRYTPLVRLVGALDTTALAAAYQRYYPLLQAAYEELGYPGRQFHNRALEVIDHLLGAPEVREPIRLEQPHVLYTFADPALEALSSGRKMMIRVGPEHSAVLRQKLIELRAALESLAEAPGVE